MVIHKERFVAEKVAVALAAAGVLLVVLSLLSACGGMDEDLSQLQRPGPALPEWEPPTPPLDRVDLADEPTRRQLRLSARIVSEPLLLDDSPRSPSPGFYNPCPLSLTLCDGICVDIHKDPNHCGGCGNACASGFCEDGWCLL
jgi:hypothetical protein